MIEQTLLNIDDLSPNIMENLHERLLDAIKRKDFQSFKQIVEENSEEQSANRIIKYIDPDTEDTYLDIVSREGLTEFVEFLLSNKAEINRVNERRNCAPIHFATEGGHKSTLAILLAQNTIDVDLETEQRTALHIAVKNNDLICVRQLLDKGASINILNNKNLTALHLAAMKKQQNIVKMMLDKYAPYLEVDRYKDYNGQTTREVIKQKLPKLSEKLPKEVFKSENKKINTEDLKYYLNKEDETNFLKCIKNIQEDIFPSTAENLLTICAQCNFQQATIAILKKFEGSSLNLRKPARAAIQSGHHIILTELLKVEPQLVNNLRIENETLLNVCRELGMPKKKGNDNLLKCLELILEQNNVNVNCSDEKGNTPLHYAARADNRKAMSLLLKHGSYIGHMNKFNVPPIVDIPVTTLLDHFDNCLKMIKNQTDKYIIEFDYCCLMSYNSFTKYNEQDTTRATREMEVFLYLARNKNLKHLLKHPLLSSFLYLKWFKIRNVLYANFVFYGIFYSILNAYILNEYSCLTVFVIVLWCVFAIREIFQFVCCPYRYAIDWENWLQLMLVVLILIFLCGAGLWSSVMVIILSALELIVLISHHPKMSTSFEMFRKVSLKYVCLLFPYTFLIIAFALAFYMLFKNSMNFSGFGHSFFKTFIMITGEFNSNDIPFESYPICSHIVFVLFVFLIAIVLYNLLNGLAVSDTNKILSKAELFGLISRIRLLIYLEDIVFGEPFNWFNSGNSRFLQWKPFSFLTRRILLSPHYLKNAIH
ncbi:PREDICTED: transient receptor potential cation channel protein painless-like isoform X2 [Wasmannia auropunctata]|uniref:transient receptor potential cation channel protein painless-like isoform X2 n=1 Tax=Wasmannia auropunctata TaxID=64793 RepID=UPI0005EFAFCB|nr:PREDICTED: transient receptor potential cation channel protein painless-like isoform X2 [Wasmannia auropunctata]